MRLIALSLATLALFAASCNSSTSTTESKSTDSTAAKAAEAISLADVPTSPDFPDAKLGISGMTATKVGADSVKLSINFDVKNYELKAQTGDASSKQCNNSDKGQHIHFILDNKPYVALYEPKQEVTVPASGEHYILCFLSRSYHESIKHREAAVLAHIKLDNGKLERLPDPTTPMIFYSRPKGDYLGKDTTNVLLDFYPTNVTLGADYKVKADVKNETNGKSASFTLDEWKSHFLKGLGTGKASVTLTLVDKNGKQVDGPNTTVTRNFNLAASEPMP